MTTEILCTLQVCKFVKHISLYLCLSEVKMYDNIKIAHPLGVEHLDV